MLTVMLALIEEENLVPLYGRGKSSSDPRSKSIPGVSIPNRPAGQRPETAPPPEPNQFPQNGFGFMGGLGGFAPMATARFGNFTLPAAFGGLIPSLFNLQVHGFPDAAMFGPAAGFPYGFSNSYHAGHAHGYHHHYHHHHHHESDGEASILCSDQVVHVAMTLDTTYIRGSMAVILSVLQHSSCPQNIAFHFVASATANASLLRSTISSSFPYLNFQVYPFDDSSVSRLISTSIRSALDCPLNYARSYLANLLHLCVRRVVYLDSDLVLVDDIAKLAATPLGDNSVLAAPEYCNANFTSYFTLTFWSNPSLSLAFANRKACYFNTGVMVESARPRGR
ncbi:hypothetical protein CRYUN_Cryun30bG0026400 [Craigia yunnanensis]